MMTRQSLSDSLHLKSLSLLSTETEKKRKLKRNKKRNLRMGEMKGQRVKGQAVGLVVESTAQSREREIQLPDIPYSN